MQFARVILVLIARQHGLHQARVRFIRQAGAAIDAGAFHNDVVSVVNERVVLAHELAFDGGRETIERLPGAEAVVVPAARVPLADAVANLSFQFLGTHALTLKQKHCHLT